jgi:imidazolonepropionase-like amidohydrolase
VRYCKNDGESFHPDCGVPCLAAFQPRSCEVETEDQGGTLVTSHCNTDAGARNAIEGGVGGIEHGGLLSDDTLRLMAKKGIHYTPTMTIQDVSKAHFPRPHDKNRADADGSIQYIVNGPLGQAIPPFFLEKAKRIEKNTYTVIRRAYELGVNIAYGTDIFVPYQLAEFDLRAKVLPGHAILQQATCNAGMSPRVPFLSSFRHQMISHCPCFSANPCSSGSGHGR